MANVKAASAFLVFLVALIMNVTASPAMSPNVKTIMKRAYPGAVPLKLAKRNPTANGKPF
ncbi:hypothetical protein, variant [Puccinia triticina 1-1 BBBD Race 1]|uniref:Uncharacterized protein n=1 Tax=Puccinia triticina (isolate 1-1 / race 1 (BBBD)) TaxID=630390 RepID=A0A180GWT6_PUCT1|nr:hypothetical protein PTTG_26204 [Puccinia triticina 1-1 BBBD Race 1]OAV96984.1 hypothetical protein, variant [Puccinia triticina 1-1 BBBD Race 1]